MRRDERLSLWSSLAEGTPAASAFPFLGASRQVSVPDLIFGTVLGEDVEAVRRRSVLLLCADPLLAALALIELDGLAARIVLYPPDLSASHLEHVVASAGVETILVDTPDASGLVAPRGLPAQVRTLAPSIVARTWERGPEQPGEWVLLTSGTTGAPKLVLHTLRTLAGPLLEPAEPGLDGVIWSTFYDIRRYGGLQIFLRAALRKTPLVLGGPAETVDSFLARAGAGGVTHISGTPSHWRRALMHGAAARLDPRYVRLSGEIADQAVLHQVQAAFPRARVAHAFASTEAGLAFEVTDGLAGFPAGFLEGSSAGGVLDSGVELKIEAGSLRIRSSRTALRYLGPDAPPLKGEDGFVDTRDTVLPENGRYIFEGRQDGVINVGGLKVHPEEVEAVINRHPDVEMSLVRAMRSPITGALVVADVVLRSERGVPADKLDKAHTRRRLDGIMSLCRGSLAAYKVPVAIHVVTTLPVSESGKLVRRHA